MHYESAESVYLKRIKTQPAEVEKRSGWSGGPSHEEIDGVLCGSEALQRPAPESGWPETAPENLDNTCSHSAARALKIFLVSGLQHLENCPTISEQLCTQVQHSDCRGLPELASGLFAAPETVLYRSEMSPMPDSKNLLFDLHLRY